MLTDRAEYVKYDEDDAIGTYDKPLTLMALNLAILKLCSPPPK